MVASYARVIGLLEQPRRSKMAWLREWQFLLQVLGATETHLASCSYGSIHQKEFRILGVNVDLSPLYAPCTKDHVHVKVQGKYTKGTAIYTDQLASRFADVIEEALRRKKSAEASLEPKVDGLESTLSNLCALSAPWKEEKSWLWKKSPHINILETSAYARLLYSMAAKHPRSRFPVGLDSNVALSAVVKGRSPFLVETSLEEDWSYYHRWVSYPACHFFPTRYNPSDHPTRDTQIPGPSPSFIDFEAEPGLLLSLHELSGLKRFAANWVRLVLFLIGPKRPWASSNDSWRFNTWSYASYPFAKVVDAMSRSLEFDKILGFPGEGPCWKCGIGLILSFIGLCSFPLCFTSPIVCFDCPFPSCFDCSILSSTIISSAISDCSGRVLALFCLLWLSFVCWGPLISGDAAKCSLGRFRWLVCLAFLPWHVASAPGTVGGLARTTGDLRRAELRKGVNLDEGRPVLGKTKEARAKLIADFELWLEMDAHTTTMRRQSTLCRPLGRVCAGFCKERGTLLSHGFERSHQLTMLRFLGKLCYVWFQQHTFGTGHG